MMFYLYVLQNQWIIMTLLAAVALVLIFCLTYQAMWHPRGVEGRSEQVKVTGPASFFVWLKSFVPWVIMLIVLGCVSFTVATVIAKAGSPPNW